MNFENKYGSRVLLKDGIKDNISHIYHDFFVFREREREGVRERFNFGVR